MDERRRMEAEIADLRKQVALGGGGQAAGPEARDVNGMAFMAQVLPGISPRDLRGLIDEHKARLGLGRGPADRRHRWQRPPSRPGSPMT